MKLKLRLILPIGLLVAAGCGGPKDYAADKTPAQLKAEEQAAIKSEETKYGIHVGH